MKPAKTWITCPAILFCIVASVGCGQEYLSNLGNKWIDPSNPSAASIGDNYTLIGPYGPFVVHFFTGSSLDEGRYPKIYSRVPRAAATNSPTVQLFELDSVTFEFQGGFSQPWSDITIEIYQQVGTNNILLGQFGNPSLNLTPTQWRWFSSFIDFHPLTNIVLQPSSEYYVSLSVPYNYPPRFAMFFCLSSKYFTPTDWRMGPTTTHIFMVWTEYLMFAVNATPILGTNSTNGSSTNSMGVAVSSVRVSAKRDGSNIVLSWPTSTAPAQLYSSPSFDSGSWSPVSTQPVMVNDNFVVTLPLSASGLFFRLQAQ
jgi:hypothetical protein